VFSHVYCAIFKMTNIHKQRISIKLSIKLCKSYNETNQMMQNAYGDQYLELHSLTTSENILKTVGNQLLMI